MPRLRQRVYLQDDRSVWRGTGRAMGRNRPEQENLDYSAYKSIFAAIILLLSPDASVTGATANELCHRCDCRRGGQDGVGSVAPTVPEIVAAHAVLGFEMADHGFDCGPAAQLAFDRGCHAPFWPEMKTLNL
jgi:hypothetical protein